jgi:hypothetical protein
MEPLDTDLQEYMVREPRRNVNPRARLNYAFAFPILGGVMMLYFITAAIFQFDISDYIDSLVGLLLVMFFVFVGLLFWGLAPREKKA